MRSLALWRGGGLAVLLAVAVLIPLDGNVEIGRASCRERVCT